MVTEHRWSVCEMCGPMVVCGKCGNNCCNGGYGTLPDGSQCDECPEAYDKQDLAHKAVDDRNRWKRSQPPEDGRNA